jgi:hypothetical protein
LEPLAVSLFEAARTIGRLKRAKLVAVECGRHILSPLKQGSGSYAAGTGIGSP